MRYWIIPANSTKYDYFTAFNDKGFVDWTKKSKYVDDENLFIENLKDNGLKTAPQGPLRVASELLEYIEKYI